MEIQRKRFEAMNLKWKIAEIDEAQNQLKEKDLEIKELIKIKQLNNGRKYI